MRNLRFVRISAALCGIVLSASTVRAQTEGPDVVPQQPNVLLLVDTSGSMEWKSSGDVSPACDPTHPNTATLSTNEKSRWIELVETLSGTIDNYSCYAEPRNATSGFSTEFQLSAVDPPYDLGYGDVYNRPMSNGCAPGPGVLPQPNNPYDFPTGAITFRPFVGGQIALNQPACAFSQERDGLLDSFDGLLRFGLMTFDTHPDPGTGLIGGGSSNKNGMQGTWSYYLSSPSRCRRVGGVTECQSGTTGDPAGCCVGTPWNCSVPAAFEVGARNAAAPPWEGRMVAFGPSAEDGTKRNEWIQEILLATRPYGATPIAGMLDDARNFLWYDDTPDPLNSGQSFGPAQDPLVNATCRPNYIILLTDGVPNTDLRPSCEQGVSSAMCPYDKPEDIANDLVTSTQHPQVRTFVVGFALSSVNANSTPIDCSTMDLTLCTPPPTDPALQACCTLNNIAYNGTPVALRGKPPAQIGLPPDDHAVFPKNPSELRSSLSRVFQTLLKQVTGRTSPVTASASATDRSGSGGNQTTGYEFTSGANVLPTGLWSAVLDRQRLTCDKTTLDSVVQQVDPTQGDDFIANINVNPIDKNRFIFTIQPDVLPNGTQRQATWTMRPYYQDLTRNDGLGHYKGTQTAFENPANLAGDVDPEAMKITNTTCGTATSPVTPLACRNQLLNWLVGLPSAKPVSRCPQPGAADCSVVGDIFHSLPQLRAGQPNEFIQDDSYLQFTADLYRRDTVLYVSSNDGFFHAFRVAPGDPNDSTHQVTSNQNNEEWSFLAPAVLPEVASMYPGTTTPMLNRIPALDGVPVIRDVAVTVGGPRAVGQSTSPPYPYVFERKASPDATQSETHSYRTIVVQGYGSKTGAYFAMDVTKPTLDTTNPTTTGPKFLWQLSTDDAGNQLFGKGSSTPLITSVYMDTKLSTEPVRLVDVAVLPGGLGDASTGTNCTATGDLASAIPTDTGQGFRSTLRCYGVNGASKNSIAGRSLTIVRLDTGEIIRTFRPASVTQPVTFTTGTNGVLTTASLDQNGTPHDLDIAAPIIGQPVAYPAGTGLPADRIFVGDAEGRLWRVDVSNPDTSKWSMNLFFDPFDATRPLGQPVQTPPVLSVDSKGQITVAFSTGDQDNLTPDPNPSAPTTYNYVTSLTEVANTDTSGVTRFQAHLNWKQEFAGGKRVLGPMTLFNRTLYFSTFQQTISPTCNDIGTSSVWGLDYILSVPASPAPLPQQNLPTIDYQNVVVSGVGLRQRPSCSTTGSTVDATSTDAILGYGAITSVSATKAGAFELVIQKGGGRTSNTGSGSSGGTSANSTPTIAQDTVAIDAPRAAARLDSWAPIIE
jgi:type IV pilus assembly protein PilY1